MFSLLRKIKGSWKGIVTYGCLFIAIVEALYFLSIIDFHPQPKKAAPADVSLAGAVSPDLKKKIGSIDVANLSFEDWAALYGLSGANAAMDADPDKDGLPNYLEYAYGTDPTKADTDGDGFTDRQEITNGYDPDAPGDAKPTVEISIDKLGVRVPMIWSQNADDTSINKDLESGVIHFPKTAAPGQVGNVLISGHSSNYAWAGGNYNHVFQNLNNLSVGDDIVFRTVQHNGRVITYHYKVSDKTIVGADDQSAFDPTSKTMVTLSTCWPIGTNLQRLLVHAELQQ